MKTFKELYEACCAACEKRMETEEVKEPTGDLKDACWKGYTAIGMKMKNGRKVPNCVPEEVELDELSKATLRRYTDDASDQVSDIDHSLKRTQKSKHLSQSSKDELKKLSDRRKKGIRLASDKRGYYKGSDHPKNFSHGSAKVHATEEVTLDEMSKLSDALAKIKHDFENPPADHKDAKPAPAKKPEPKKGGGMPYYPDSRGGRRYMGDSVEMDGETIAESNEENARAKVRETHSQILKKGYKYIGSEQRSVGKDDSLVTHNYLSKDGSHIHHMQYSPYTMTGKGGPHIFHKKTKFNAKLHDHLTEQCFNYFDGEVEQIDEASPNAGKNVVPPTAGTIGSIGGLVREEENENKPLGKVMRAGDGKKKFKVFVKNSKGNTVKVGFGDPNMEIKRDDPERRKNFRARHNCDTATDRTTPRYWSCRQWRSSAKVEA
jgi:hypothetical protein